MTAQLSPLGVQKFYDNNGNPLSFGLLYTYAAGTTNPQASYVDSTQTTQNTNPIQLNFRGECNLWLDPTLTYKLLLTDSAGDTIPNWPVDNIPGGPFITATGSITVPVSLIPTTTNTFSLGNSTHSWSELYLGANASPALDTATGIIGYYPRTPAETTAGVTPSDFAYQTWDVRRMGVVGDGTTDDTAALQRCYTVGGDWWVAPGLQIRCTSTITGVIATHLYSDSSVTPIPGGVVSQAFLIHDFSGTFFDLVGSATSQITGSGFGFSRISFVQKNGNGSGASGVCIRNIQVSATQECPWLRVEDCHFEQGSGTPNDWTYCIQMDGTNQVNPQNLRDHFISKCRFVSGSHATASVLLNGVSNVWLIANEANLTNGNIVITGLDASHPSRSITLLGNTASAIQLDFATGVYGSANDASTFTSTVNSTDVALGVTLGVSQTVLGTRVSIYGESAGGKFQICSTNNVRMELLAGSLLESAGSVQIGAVPAVSGALRLENAATIVGRNSTNASDIPLLSASSTNRVLIAPGGDTVGWGRPPVALGGGAAATLGTIGGSGPGTAAQFEWLQVFDTSGNACFIPVWK